MEKLFSDEQFRVYRLTCKCFGNDHNIDVLIEVEEGKDFPYVEWRFYKVGWKSWCERLKDIWQILKGGEIFVDSFNFREEDFGPLAEMFLVMHWKAEERGLLESWEEED